MGLNSAVRDRILSGVNYTEYDETILRSKKKKKKKKKKRKKFVGLLCAEIWGQV